MSSSSSTLYLVSSYETVASDEPERMQIAHQWARQNLHEDWQAIDQRVNYERERTYRRAMSQGWRFTRLDRALAAMRHRAANARQRLREHYEAWITAVRQNRIILPQLPEGRVDYEGNFNGIDLTDD